MTTGILLVDKPTGMSSHDVVARVRRALQEKSCGHAGTLDPQATGLLVLALGDATRWLPYLGDDKRYEAKLRLGVHTDTQDIWGKVLAQRPVDDEQRASLKAAVMALSQERLQVPPMVSALKRDGRPLYELAREGIEVERKPRPIQVWDVEYFGQQGDEVHFALSCSSGTYVRTLCHDLGKRLGCGASLSALRRLKVGSLKVEKALSLELIEREPNVSRNALLDADQALGHLPQHRLSEQDSARVAKGQTIAVPGVTLSEGTWRLLRPEGGLQSLAQAAHDGQAWKLSPRRVFA